jgi:hypothetical protein
VADVTSSHREPRSTRIGAPVALRHGRTATVDVVKLWQRPITVHLSIDFGDGTADDEGWAFTPAQAAEIGAYLTDAANAAVSDAAVAEVFAEVSDVI